MIEKKPKGLLVQLDEEIVMPKGTDETWFNKIKRFSLPSLLLPLSPFTYIFFSPSALSTRPNTSPLLSKRGDTLLFTTTLVLSSMILKVSWRRTEIPSGLIFIRLSVRVRVPTCPRSSPLRLLIRRDVLLLLEVFFFFFFFGTPFSLSLLPSPPFFYRSIQRTIVFFDGQVALH